jgi:tetratricopeptide (TPR) repeat protein
MNRGRARRARWVARCGFFGISLFAAFAAGPVARAQTELGPTESAEVQAGAAVLPAVPFCLRTEFFPAGHDENSRPDRLAREIGRQAVLIAARDTLGLATRDDTLQEPFPEEVVTSLRMINAAPRARRDGKFTLTIWAGTSTIQASRRGRGNPQGAPKPWLYETTFTATPYESYISLLARLEPATRGEIADALRTFGFDGKAPAANVENQPPASIESLLLEMNFVSPYVAVRTAHAAIAKNGESPEWLGVLVRGYANLSLTTFHHWTSMNEAFAARALLYAERLVNQKPDDPLAHAHRAYARALIGMHAAALAGLKEIETLQQQLDQPVELPAWVAAIGPYCRFQREPLTKLASEQSQLVQLVHRLSFEQTSVFEDHRWLMDAAEPAIAACPEEYGIYSMLAKNESPLSVKRTGAYYGPAAMGHYLPQRIAAIADVPKPIRDAIDGNHAAIPGAVDDIEPNDPFSAVVANAARGLVDAASHDTVEPSWAVLGKLVEEEQFVEIANFFGVATDATESSLEAGVDAVWPLIKDHRYAWYVKTFSVKSRSDRERYYEIVGDPRFVDARGNMYRMFRVAWSVKPNATNSGRGRIASWQACIDSSLTLPELLCSLDQASYYWWTNMTPDRRQGFAADLEAVSPHAPQSLRYKIALTAEVSPEQARQWEQAAGEDPGVYISMGAVYTRLGLHDDAVRCYERSIELSPSYNAHVGLADSFRAAGQPELWQPTLERFLEVPALGLEHGYIHQRIAADYIEKSDWQGAEKHALGAAETWSAWGLRLAAAVYEGMGRWDESEKWVQAMSTAYPTNSGTNWYFWCRRTGRGNLDEARELVKNVATSTWKENNPGEAYAYHLVEGQPQEARPFLQKWIEAPSMQNIYDQIYTRALLALLARELGDKELQTKAIAEVKERLNKDREALSKPDADYPAVIEFVCGLLEDDDMDAAATADHIQHIDRMSVNNRRCYSYVAGRALELREQDEAADNCYRLIIDRSPFDFYPTIFAGQRLAARHGTSRPASD